MIRRPAMLFLCTLALVATGLILYRSFAFESDVDRTGDEETDAVSLQARSLPLSPLPTQVPLDPKKVRLGRKLFHDKRLSRDDTVSCSSCHNLNKCGTDHESHSRGMAGAMGELNTPTVFNSAYNFRQFWDGRAATLEEQVDGPINNPKELSSNWDEILSKLRADSEYRTSFAEAYPDGLQAANVANAIAIFERSLTTANSPFDRYLRGESGAISEDARRGYDLFRGYGCVACHQGVNVGGNMYARFGIMADYFKERGHVTQPDLGRFNVTGKESDRHRFKVPSLRNVALTEPYFHDGSEKTLRGAVNVMAKYQLGRHIDKAEVLQIIEFLKSLSGEVPEEGR